MDAFKIIVASKRTFPIMYDTELQIPQAKIGYFTIEKSKILTENKTSQITQRTTDKLGKENLLNVQTIPRNQ